MPRDGELTVNREWLEDMVPAQRNRLLKHSLEGILGTWRYKHLPKRFTPAVLGAPWSYRTKRHNTSQRARRFPLDGARRPRNPKKLKNAVFTGKISATVSRKSGRIMGKIAMPLGHPVKGQIAAVFRYGMTNQERQEAAEQHAATLANAKRDTVATRYRGKPRLRFARDSVSAARFSSRRTRARGTDGQLRAGRRGAGRNALLRSIR